MFISAMVFVLGCALNAWQVKKRYMVVIALLLYFLKKKVHLPLIFFSGFIYYYIFSFCYFYDDLNKRDWNQWLYVKGKVISIPKKSAIKKDFLFKVDVYAKESSFQNAKKLNQTIFLSVYDKNVIIEPGARYRLFVKLKPIRGLKNPGTRDRGKAFLAKGIKYKGYIKSVKKVDLANPYTFLHWQFILSQQIEKVLHFSDNVGVIESLALGLRNNLSYSHQSTLRDTGTSHLIAISGLHVGLVAGLSYFVFKWLWQCSSYLCLFLPSIRAASLFALAFSTLYGLLTGFSVSCQRALVMLYVFLLAKFFNLQVGLLNVYGIALFLVVLVNPFHVLSPGFYLSFYAVFVLIFLSQMIPSNHFSFLKLQVLLVIALSPLSIFYFSMVSVMAVFANLVAIPFVSWLLVPFLLLATFILLIFKSAGYFLLVFVDKLVDYLFIYLNFIVENGSFFLIKDIYLSFFNLLLVVLVLLLLVLPRALKAYHFSFFLFLPLIFPRMDVIKGDEMKVNVFDVGQGTSVLMRSKDKVYLYDTGPRWFGGNDAAREVILPFLKKYHIQKIDKVIISHQDLDHRGGLDSLKKEIAIGVVINNKKGDKLSCFNQDDWYDNEFLFSFLKANQSFKKENDKSCVLRISNGENAFLLSGDIEKKAEKSLIAKKHHLLKANYLLVPHHGSNSSSTQAFINAVSPKYVLFTTGFINQFGFPKNEVIARYKGRELFNTANCGMISFTLSREIEKSPSCFSIPLTNRNAWF